MESEELRELKSEIEKIKEHLARMEKELLSVEWLVQKAFGAAAML